MEKELNKICSTCPRHCNINRNTTTGFCGVGNTVKVARAGLHFWEEPLISGTKGSGIIFFSGCNLKCCYCQNYEISHNCYGKEISVERLAEIFRELEVQGANNINLVTPSHYAYQIAEALSIYKPNIPVVYNTSGYDSVETIQFLKPYIDIYLTDIKYVSSELSKEYSGAQNYFKFASMAILEMKKNQPQDIIINGLMKKGVIIRHMVLPGCSSDSVAVLNWIKSTIGNNAIISVMCQYVPVAEAKTNVALNRKISLLEYKRVVQKMSELGFENGYLQEMESASVDYIPKFDLSGV